jgi:hypothetical protein
VPTVCYHSKVASQGSGHPADDIDAVLRTNLTADVTDPQSDIASQEFTLGFCRPNEMITMVKNATFFLLKYSRLEDEEVTLINVYSILTGLEANEISEFAVF